MASILIGLGLILPGDWAGYPTHTHRGLQDCPAVPVSVPIGRLVMHTTAMHALREVHYGSNIKKSLRSLGRKGSLYLFLTYSQALSGSLG